MVLAEACTGILDGDPCVSKLWTLVMSEHTSPKLMLMFYVCIKVSVRVVVVQ